MPIARLATVEIRDMCRRNQNYERRQWNRGVISPTRHRLLQALWMGCGGGFFLLINIRLSHLKIHSRISVEEIIKYLSIHDTFYLIRITSIFDNISCTRYSFIFQLPQLLYDLQKSNAGIRLPCSLYTCRRPWKEYKTASEACGHSRCQEQYFMVTTEVCCSSVILVLHLLSCQNPNSRHNKSKASLFPTTVFLWLRTFWYCIGQTRKLLFSTNACSIAYGHYILLKSSQACCTVHHTTEINFVLHIH